ncbi:progranulin-like isoform X2 [Brachionichthys hirsutus]|uniref:progranulin-like isoform X2 n=1 Tax=Brachionichthys hirsutus TaxID=412623 RepID=UPI0036044EEC
MLKVTLCLSVAVIVLEFASCSITCPDRSSCEDSQTCCMAGSGYGCCPLPNAKCCSDSIHCCPFGYDCNLATQTCEKQNQPWMQMPMAMKQAPSKRLQSASDPQEPKNDITSLNYVPEELKSSAVQCDSFFQCPDGSTCCRHPGGPWFCCVYYHAACCLDGLHCCPFGYHCDLTYTYCYPNRLRYPFLRKPVSSSVPATLISRPEADMD